MKGIICINNVPASGLHVSEESERRYEIRLSSCRKEEDVNSLEKVWPGNRVKKNKTGRR